MILKMFSTFKVGDTYHCKTREGFDCLYTVVSRSNNVITFHKQWSPNNIEINEFKKFKINSDNLTEKVLIWMYHDEKCYICANDKQSVISKVI